MKLKRTFLQGKINKDLDERLLPDGQYPHAENIRVANTDASDLGALENCKGTYQMTDFNLTNPTIIGACTDSSNEKIYWFTTSDDYDLVVEYDMKNSMSYILLQESRNKPNRVLNFDKNYLITGVNKLINGDYKKDLLLFTDDLNSPKCINIERAKTYGIDSFEEDDICLIKKPPRFAPTIQLTFTNTILENNLENKFISFSYRYKYLDGEYSALSSYSNYSFAPKKFDIDYQTMENKGMVNSFNAVNIMFNTGDKRVTDIEIVYKESNSNTLYLIETFNKAKQNWGNDEIRSFKFANSKIYRALAEDELYRPYDNVPRFAKSQELIGNRIIYGNYVEGYDLKDIYNQKMKIDYDVSLINKSLIGENLPMILNGGILTLDFSKIKLIKDSSINFEILLDESTGNGDFKCYIGYILNKDYDNADLLAEDEDFIFFIEEILTNNFIENYVTVPPDNSEIKDTIKFKILSSTSTFITISAPSIIYTIDDTPTDTADNPSNTHEQVSKWDYSSLTGAYYNTISIKSSLKTNRSYEVGIIYLDKYGRSTTALTCANNTIYIPQEYCTYQNRLMITLNHLPPYWADRYKLVVKQNKEDYHTIYVNTFYDEGVYKWIKLEGTNKDKVKEGDILIAKSDLGGVIEDPVKIRVLELSNKPRNFIEDNFNVDGIDINEEEGLYMKIKPDGVDMTFNKGTIRTFQGGQHLRYPTRTWTQPMFGDIITGIFDPYEIKAGSVVKIYIHIKGRGAIDNVNHTYDKSFRVQGDYSSIRDWFEKEVKNLGSFGKNYTWNGIDDIGSNIKGEGAGQADANNQYSGWGWSSDGSNFFVVPFRKGTSSRKITTTLKFEVMFSEGTVIFETEPKDSKLDIFYETEQTFEIIDNFHTGNLQNQDLNNPSLIELNFFNCYVQGNGAESYRYKDAFNVNYLNIDLRPTTTSVEEYKEVKRYADLTYSEVYNENNNINGLNEFNLSRLNYKEDIDKKYGFIQKLHSRDTDLLVFQEDKVSKILYGKSLLMNADGSDNVSSINDVLGQQIAFKGEYGISRNPESFAFDGFNIYFSDAKRGAVMRLAADGLNEISAYGLRQFFKDKFRDGINNKKVGAFDPYYDEYVIHPSDSSIRLPINMTCSDGLSRDKFTGEQIIYMEYGALLGVAGISYNTNGIPIRFTIEWNGNTYTSGFIGDTSYNDELISLGYNPISGDKIGELKFNKNNNSPTKAKIKIFSPFCDSSFNMKGICINNKSKNVLFIVSNQPYYQNKHAVNRFKWVLDSLSSSNKSNDITFNEGLVSHYEIIEGIQGTGFIPPNGSLITLEYTSKFDEDDIFKNGGRFGYLLSNNKYTKEEINIILQETTFISSTLDILPNGDKIYKGDFILPTTFDEDNIYIIFNYQSPPIAVDDFIQVEKGKFKTYDIRDNDINYNGDKYGLSVILVENPKHGNVIINDDGTITYYHDNSDDLTDSFTYYVNDGYANSNIATVHIDIAMSCNGSFSQRGEQGTFDVPISYGTAIGQCGITYNAYNVPDKFEIIWDGKVVATTSTVVQGSGSLIFQKDKVLPTSAIIRVTAPNEGTVWDIWGVCPNVNFKIPKYNPDNIENNGL